MPVVVCPKCQRRLHLPEDAIGAEAKCPLCKAVFPAEPEGGRPRPVSELRDVPDPTAPWRPPGERGPTPLHDPAPSQWQGRPQNRDRAQLSLAGTWLFGLSIACLVWNMTCGCAALVSIAHEGEGLEDTKTAVFLAAHMGHLASMVVILLGGQAMRQARSVSLAWAGVWTALGQVIILIAMAAMMLQSRSEFGHLFSCISMLFPVALFIAGCYGSAQLSRPAIKALFEQQGGGREDD